MTEHLPTYVTWDATKVDVSSIRPSDVDSALARFRSQLPELVWNAAALEGNTYTLPEVRALLEEVSVAGKPLDDERQILALSEAYGHLDQLLADRAFRLTRARRTPYTPSWPAMRPWTRAGSVAKGPRPVVVMCACLTGPWSRAPTRVRAAPSCAPATRTWSPTSTGSPTSASPPWCTSRPCAGLPRRPVPEPGPDSGRRPRAVLHLRGASLLSELQVPQRLVVR